MSETVKGLERGRALAWAGLQPAFDHAIMQAKECEYIAGQAMNLAQCSVAPVYPPLVTLLAEAVSR